MLKTVIRTTAIAFIATWFTGCAEQEKQSPVEIRPVKVEVVADTNQLTNASFMGVSRAKKRSSRGRLRKRKIKHAKA